MFTGMYKIIPVLDNGKVLNPVKRISDFISILFIFVVFKEGQFDIQSKKLEQNVLNLFITCVLPMPHTKP